MSRWRWTLLIFELLLFAVILILPQVELPDFTFHGGTAPVVMKTRLSSGTARASVVNPVQLPMPVPVLERRLEITDPPSATDADTRLSMLCTLTC
jgi:hypothetical protein